MAEIDSLVKELVQKALISLKKMDDTKLKIRKTPAITFSFGLDWHRDTRVILNGLVRS